MAVIGIAAAMNEWLDTSWVYTDLSCVWYSYRPWKALPSFPFFNGKCDLIIMKCLRKLPLVPFRNIVIICVINFCAIIVQVQMHFDIVLIEIYKHAYFMVFACCFNIFIFIGLMISIFDGCICCCHVQVRLEAQRGELPFPRSDLGLEPGSGLALRHILAPRRLDGIFPCLALCPRSGWKSIGWATCVSVLFRLWLCTWPCTASLDCCLWLFGWSGTCSSGWFRPFTPIRYLFAFCVFTGCHALGSHEELTYG